MKEWNEYQNDKSSMLNKVNRPSEVLTDKLLVCDAILRKIAVSNKMKEIPLVTLINDLKTFLIKEQPVPALRLEHCPKPEIEEKEFEQYADSEYGKYVNRVRNAVISDFRRDPSRAALREDIVKWNDSLTVDRMTEYRTSFNVVHK